MIRPKRSNVSRLAKLAVRTERMKTYSQHRSSVGHVVPRTVVVDTVDNNNDHFNTFSSFTDCQHEPERSDDAVMCDVLHVDGDLDDDLSAGVRSEENCNNELDDDLLMFGIVGTDPPTGLTTLPTEPATNANHTRLSTTYVGLAKLHEMAMESGVPLTFVDDILRVVKSPDFNINECHSRSTFFQNVRTIDSENGTPEVAPSRVSIDNGATSFSTFSIFNQIKDLINSALFQNLENLAISNNEDPLTLFQKFECSDEERNLEVHSAKWYTDTYATLIENPGVDWLFPLIFYIDKTGTDVNQRFPLEPLMVTTSLLKRSVREKSDAWRHLGFLPTCDDPQASAEEALEYFHLCLSKILDELIGLQRNPPEIEFVIGGVVYKKRLLLPVAFVIGDQMSQDKLCGRKAINAGGAGRIHRGCMTLQLHASSPNHATSNDGICVRVNKERILELTSLSRMTESEMKDIVRNNIPTITGKDDDVVHEERILLLSHLQRRTKFARIILERVYSMYPIKNAWTDVCFGANQNGIYRATLDDPMHYCDSGSFFYLTQVAFLSLTPKERQEMEDIIKDYFKGKRSSVRDDFPRGKFTSGFSRVTLLTAGEKTGLVFALSLALGTARGTQLYTKAISRMQEKYEHVHKSDGTFKKYGDKHFFADHRVANRGVKMDRTLEGVQKLVHAMRRHEVLSMVGATDCDELQTEYLLQSVQTFLASDSIRYPTTQPIDGLFSSTEHLSPTEVRIAKRLFMSLRQDVSGEDSSDGSESPSTAKHCKMHHPKTTTSNEPKSFIKKHKWDRSKCNTPGPTSAILTDLKGFQNLLMHGLAFHSFVHYFEEIPSEDRANGRFLHDCVAAYVKIYTDGIYRGDDTVDCETPKIHAHLHLAGDIIDFGHPMNWDAGKGERGLKDWAKVVSSTAQKQNLSDFTYQTAMRICDCALLKRVQQNFGSKNPKPAVTLSEQLFRRLAHFRINTDSGIVESIDRRRGTGETWSGRPLFHALVLKALKSCEDRNGKPEVHVWKNGQLNINGNMKHIRASSCFDNRGQFYDWVSVQDADRQSWYPAKLLILFDDLNSEKCAIVQCCEWQNHIEKRQDTPISSRWSLEFNPKNGEPILRKIVLKDVVDVLYTVEHRKEEPKGLGFNTICNKVRGKCYVDVIEPRYAWANNFIK